MWEIPLADTEIGEEEVEAVSRVLRSGWLTAGPETTGFESEFAARVGVRHAIAVSNCTAALHLANLALGIGPGDEVVCPALSFAATANATRYTGADVVFADVLGPDDLTVSPADVEAKLSARTRAIAVLHYAGFACDMQPILDLARRHDLFIVEDCAHAPLAHWRSGAGARRRVGTIGAIGCFSFFGNKNMTTGEGGMLTTDDDALAERLRLYRSHGMTTTTYDRYRGHAHGYDVVVLGYNYRIDDIRAAIGRVQLRKLDELHRLRRQVFGWYLEELSGVAGVVVPFAGRDLDDATPHVMSIVVETDARRVTEALTERRIQTSRHYDPINGFSIYRDARGETPVTDALQLVTLPFAPRLTRDQVARVGSGVRQGVAQRSRP